MPGRERRRAERVYAGASARWEGVLVQRHGTVVDISSTGCFILTSDEVVTGELIRVEIETPDGFRACLWGNVVYQLEEMGFAIEFTGATHEEAVALEDLLISLRAVQFLGTSPRITRPSGAAHTVVTS